MSDKPFRTTIGGQAVLEGILLLGPEATAVAVRVPDGSVVVREFPPRIKRLPRHPLSWPLVRGVYTLGSTLRLGYAALDYSASLFPEEPEGDSRLGRWMEKHWGAGAAQKIVMPMAMVLGAVLAVGLFFLLPTLVAGWLSFFLPQSWMKNAAEGGVRLLIFLCYLLLISRMEDIRRLFAYHGAEHKVIACYEAGAPLTVEAARRYSRRHPRCGTSFILVVILVSVLVFSGVNWANAWVRVALRLAFLPLVIAVSYEINRLVGRYDNPVTRFFRAPGFWLQGLTTREPDDSMLEVGLAALREVLPAERGSDAW